MTSKTTYLALCLQYPAKTNTLWLPSTCFGFGLKTRWSQRGGANTWLGRWSVTWEMDLCSLWHQKGEKGIRTEVEDGRLVWSVHWRDRRLLLANRILHNRLLPLLVSHCFNVEKRRQSPPQDPLYTPNMHFLPGAVFSIRALRPRENHNNNTTTAVKVFAP